MSAIATLEQVLITGNLADLTPDQRVTYYQRVCDSLGMNELTKPFAYITLNGKLMLYATKDCTDQLRKRDKVSLRIVSREILEGVYVVTSEATLPDGRTDSSTGAVPIEKMQGEARANAMMKAETKSKRRVTLSICGLGMLDESEVDSIPQVRAEGKKGENFTAVTGSTGPLPIATTGNGNEPPDTAAVNECLSLIGECKNRTELETVAAGFAANPKLTEGGKNHLRDEYKRRWKELPKAIPVNEDSEPDLPGGSLPPY